MNLYIKLSVCVPRLIPGRGFYAQISSEITSEFPGVTSAPSPPPKTTGASSPSSTRRAPPFPPRRPSCPLPLRRRFGRRWVRRAARFVPVLSVCVLAPPFAGERPPPEPSSRRAAAAGGDVIADVVVALSREPVVDRSISAVRFGWIDLGRPFAWTVARAPGPPNPSAADAINPLFLFKNNSLLRHNSI